MFKLLSTTIAASLMTTGLVAFTGNEALAGPTDCTQGSVTNNIYSYAACTAQDRANDVGRFGTLLTGLQNNIFFGDGFDTSGIWDVFEDVMASNNLGEGLGTWSFELGANFFGDIVVSLKAGNGYAAYLFENVAASQLEGGLFAGLFNTANHKDLSHMTIATMNKPMGPRNVAPEPFSMLGAGLALGVGAWLKKRQP